MAKHTALIFGTVFVLVALVGYIPNPVVGADAIFATDSNHNLAHLLIGVVLVIVSTRGERASIAALNAVGLVYGLLALLGFLSVGTTGHTMLLGLVHLNGADNWLHLALAVVLLAAAVTAARLARGAALAEAIHPRRAV